MEENDIIACLMKKAKIKRIPKKILRSKKVYA